MQKTVLLTGANGLLGQKIVEKLATRTAVRLIATATGPNRNGVREGYVYEQWDITNRDRLVQLIEQYRPTELINCAAMTHVDKCESERERCWAINMEAVKMMAEVCDKHNIRLIHISTDFIFDGEEGPYAEDAEGNPLSYYGESKFEAEKAIESSGVLAAIVRTVLVYGVVSDGSRSNIVLWAKGALEKGGPINVVNDQFRSPTLAEDLAEGVILILMKDKTGVFHLSGPDQMCITDIVRGVGKYWGLPTDHMGEVDSKTLNQAAKRPPVTGFIILKAQTELGYKPLSFQDGLAVVDRQLKAQSPN